MQNASSQSLLRRVEVEDRTKLCRSTLYAKGNPKDRGFDPSFPVAVRVGSTSVRWIASEIEAWIESRPRTRNKLAEHSVKGGEK